MLRGHVLFGDGCGMKALAVDVCGLGGAAMLGYGLWLVHPALLCVVYGGGMFAAALAWTIAKRKGGR